MTDASNIDDILKSIDALLKEGHEEQRQNDDVTDDAIDDVTDTASANTDAETPVTAVSDAIAEQAEISILPDIAGDDSDGESADHLAAPEVADANEAETEHTDVDVQPDAPINEKKKVVKPAGQHDAEAPEKRIVLSADMQVQDGPELPLNAPLQTVQVESPETASADVTLAVIDEAQVARITADVCAALNQQLPEIIAPLVAEALRRHLSADDTDAQRE